MLDQLWSSKGYCNLDDLRHLHHHLHLLPPDGVHLPLHDDLITLKGDQSKYFKNKNVQKYSPQKDKSTTSMSAIPLRTQERPPSFLGGHAGDRAHCGKLGD